MPPKKRPGSEEESSEPSRAAPLAESSISSHHGSNSSSKKRLHSRDLYTIGWIAALVVELTAAISMLDEEHETPEDFSRGARDSNIYIWGEIAGHNIVVTSLPVGTDGLVSTSTTASNLLSAFPSIKFGLMVGIGSGVPQLRNEPDIRLGDVVVSQPDGTSGGVFQYDLGKAKTKGEFEVKGCLNRPPDFLLRVLDIMKAEIPPSHPTLHRPYLEAARHGVNKPNFEQHLSRISDDMAEPEDGEPGYVDQGSDNDRLFYSDFPHVPGDTCCQCAPWKEIKRTERKKPGPRVHYGVIASVNTVVKDSHTRNRLVQRVPGKCLCLEMETAGLMNDFPCFIIRGICDYGDSHKNDRWQPYSALTAAAYARELLHWIPKQEVEHAKKATELMRAVGLDVKEASAIAKDTNQRVVLCDSDGHNPLSQAAESSDATNEDSNENPSQTINQALQRSDSSGLRRLLKEDFEEVTEDEDYSYLKPPLMHRGLSSNLTTSSILSRRFHSITLVAYTIQSMIRCLKSFSLEIRIPS
ncbi:hypothetical protein SLS54_009343 [Diplodia seriata]